MAHFEPSEDDDKDLVGAPVSHNPLTVPAATGLWVVVGGLLAYGILQTVIKASALFGG